jgi:hypothetical protein
MLNALFLLFLGIAGNKHNMLLPFGKPVYSSLTTSSRRPLLLLLLSLF